MQSGSDSRQPDKNMEDTKNIETSVFRELGAQPSTSEERGLALLRPRDKVVFSPGISTAGFAEIRMAQGDPGRKIIATTIDKKGLSFTDGLVKRLGMGAQVETRLEDLLGPWKYPPGAFDFIYARLVLHYLSADNLDTVLQNFVISLRPGGKIFVVVQSTKNIDPKDQNVQYEPSTHFTSVSKYSADGSFLSIDKRYFHTDQSIQEHLQKAGFLVESSAEYDEQLYHDYVRTDEAIGDRTSHLIEVVATRP